jgi:hypothetical protein
VRKTPSVLKLHFFMGADLLWSMIYRDGEGGSLREDVELKRREFLSRQWDREWRVATAERSSQRLLPKEVGPSSES